ncbi:hypothetical protein B0H19DRAFT_1071940 [Mycena capillaripes]|nr:hypothetical protein B0H19DRAFT_1071940 [Mycena capillaripes]
MFTNRWRSRASFLVHWKNSNKLGTRTVASAQYRGIRMTEEHHVGFKLECRVMIKSLNCAEKFEGALEWRNVTSWARILWLLKSAENCSWVPCGLYFKAKRRDGDVRPTSIAFDTQAPVFCPVNWQVLDSLLEAPHGQTPPLRADAKYNCAVFGIFEGEKYEQSIFAFKDFPALWMYFAIKFNRRSRTGFLELL